MGEPTWRPIKEVMVPERPTNFWTPALEYVTPGRLYRIVVEPTAGPPAQDQTWIPASATQACTAEGDAAQARQGLPVETCAVGALIGKIGGSSAEVKPDKDKVVLFGVGRHCVISVEAAKAGALYLGVNDTHASAIQMQGQLRVMIYEAL
jgi:hypothetical protein